MTTFELDYVNTLLAGDSPIDLFDTGWNLDTTNSALRLRPGATIFAGLGSIIDSTTQVGATPLAGYTSFDINSHTTKDLALPLIVQSESADDLPAAIGEALRKLDPLMLGGLLRAEYTNTEARYLEGHIIAGLNSVVVGYKDSRTALIPAVFRAALPYWAGPTVTAPTVTTSAGSPGVSVDNGNYGNAYPSGHPGFTHSGSQAITLAEDVVGAWPTYVVNLDGCTVGVNAIALRDASNFTSVINGVGIYPGTVNTDPTLRSLLTDTTAPSIVRPMTSGSNTLTYAVEILSGSGSPTLTAAYKPLYLTPE